MNNVQIGLLQPDDRARWSELWSAYLTYYDTVMPPERYDATWAKLLEATRLYAFVARSDGALVGITHYLFHPSTWMDQVCYLQDLFVVPEARCGGVATALIEAVAHDARARCCGRLYWMTKEENGTARRLYDRIARFNGFIRYDYRL